MQQNQLLRRKEKQQKGLSQIDTDEIGSPTAMRNGLLTAL